MNRGREGLSPFDTLGNETHGKVMEESLTSFEFSFGVQRREAARNASATNSKSFASSRAGTKLKIVNLCTSFGSSPVISKKKAFPETRVSEIQSLYPSTTNESNTHMQQSCLNSQRAIEEYWT